MQGAAVVKKRRPKVLPGDPVELKTKDGWTLAAQHAPARMNKPTFLLLHETGGRKENWYYLARGMARRGIGVMVLDLRGHGGSRNPPPGVESNWLKFRTEKDNNEWNSMVLDVEAAVDYLKSEGVTSGDIGLGGADVGSSIALRYAATHQEMSMIFMLSPGFHYREVLTVNPLRAYGKRPILMAVGADDKRSTAETPILFQIAKIAAGPDNAVLVNLEREHGTRMLATNKGFITRLLDWMEFPLKAPELMTFSTGAPDGTKGLSADEELKNGLPPSDLPSDSYDSRPPDSSGTPPLDD